MLIVYMPNFVYFVCKWSPTELAFPGFLSRMGLNVPLEATLFAKLFGTDCALIWFFSCVTLCVPFEAKARSEFFVATRICANKRFL